ncbi:SGNH/GDSL hydrolase family protein [Mucilaginibacter terrae]|uniref:Acyl-CoA thioesterase-1 n=1 Tax=Mucilaginibacter terrae TaxID=1955052 RepID=A0ABU3GTN9_9SPHI|nr:SGNH/GDSL hydrolase family protein [Mucilaginibacter terrae]MDT3402337.1 acyl-CoA thioesterase-1 [Mucilaginibacter terrae]
MKKQTSILLLALAAAFSACKKDAATAQSGSETGNLATTSLANARNTPGVIVIIGASTAAGSGATPIDSSWVNRLRSETAGNPVPLKYINLAKGGYTSYEGMPTGFVKSGRPAPDTARNITKALSYHPSLVMITFPSNDIAKGYASDEVVNNYAAIVRKLDSAKVPYILFGTQPRDFTDATRRVALKDLNDRLASIYGNKANDYFGRLDTTDYKIKGSLAAGDGVHLNNKGHYVVLLSVKNHPVFRATLQGK